MDGGWADNTSYDNVNPLVFTGNSVCVTPLQCEQLLLFFEQFVTADFVSDCVTETNRHAAQMSSGTALSPVSRIRNWVDTTVSELLLYIGLLILLSLIHI